MSARKIRISGCPFTCWPVHYQRTQNSIRFSSTSTALAPARLLVGSNTTGATKTESVQKDEKSRRSTQHPSARTAHIRFWEPVSNVADVWVVKCALEKKFGAILETHFLKDFEVHDKYQMMAFVVFRDTAALQRIPESGEEFTILAPEIPRKPIHEISLNDLEQYARTDEYQQGFEFDKPESKTTKRVIGGNIRRSTIASSYDRFPFQQTSRRTMEHFLKWGGFSNRQFDMLERVTTADLFKPNAREEHTRMRAALQICSRNTSLPIPQRAVSDNLTTDVGQVGSLTEQTARVFAGLYNNANVPTIGRLNRDVKKDYTIEKVSVDQVPAPSLTIATLEQSKDVSHRAETTCAPTTLSDVNSSSPPPIRQPTITAEDKQKLESQLNAARLLQMTTTPVRRKQPKPPIIKPPKKLKKNLLNLDEAFVEERPLEKKGILARIRSMFGG